MTQVIPMQLQKIENLQQLSMFVDAIQNPIKYMQMIEEASKVLNKLKEVIEKKYKIEGDLRREIAANIKRLKEIKTYRGTRHSKRLPSRGQRTKTNSRTLRGNVRITMGSGRKKAEKT